LGHHVYMMDKKIDMGRSDRLRKIYGEKER
jgi:hypothetical protein